VGTLATGETAHTEVIIVHGVGYVEKGTNERSVQQLADRFWPGSRVSEYPWGEHAPRPTTDGDLDFEYLFRLGRVLRSAAWMGHTVREQPTPYSRMLAWISNTAASLLLFCCLSGFILGLGTVLAWADQMYGWQRTSIWNEETGKGSVLITEMASLLLGSKQTYEYIFGAFAAFVSVGLGSAALGLVTSTLARGIAGFIEESRRIFLTLIWPPVWLLCCMAIFPVRMIALSFAILLLPIFATGHQVRVLEFGDFSYFVPTIIAVVALAAILSLVRFTAGLFSYQIRLLADVFLYLGDSGYRQKLLEDLRERMRSVAGSTHLVVAGHSLGSVIAADALQAGCHARSVTLLTMGSPLVRLFRRFFPSQVPSHKQRLLHLGECCSSFQWINVYRPFDWIGSGLGGGANYFSEHSTGQIRDPFSSHTAYWSDPKVAEIFRDEARRTPRADSVRVGPTTAGGTPGRSCDPGIYPDQNKAPRWAASIPFALLVACVPLGTLVDNHVLIPANKNELIAQRHLYLERHGIAAEATVSPIKQVVAERGPEGTNYYPSYRIALTWDSNGQEYEETIRSQLLIDMPKLEARFRNPQTSYDFRRAVTRFDSFNTRIIFDPNHPSRFSLPEFHTSAPEGDSLYAVLDVIYPILDPIISTFFLWGFFVPLYAMLFGVSGPTFIWLPAVCLWWVYELLSGA
jgi:hypothetical protein